MNDYWELADEKVWQDLYDKFVEQKYLIEYVITTATKKNIEEDLKCIGALKNILEQKLAIPIIQAA